MSSSKKSKSVAEQIDEILKPKALVDGETDNVETRIEDFDESSDFKVPGTSAIRKQTAKSLSEIDKKYHGAVASRKDFELDDEDDSEDEAEAEEEEDSDSEEDPVEDGSEDEDDNSGSEDDEDDENFSNEDNFDISQFSKPTPEQEAKTEILKSTSLNEEIMKGVCVQNQQKIWEKLLEVRIKSHKMLMTANSFPNADEHLELSTTEDSEFAGKAEEVCDNVHNLLDKFLEMQETLVGSFPESKNLLKRKTEQKNSGPFLKRSKLAEFSDTIEERHDQYLNFRNEVFQKWYERTKTVKDLKNATEALKFNTKIENALLGKREMIRKSQLYRGDYKVYGIKMLKKEEDELQVPEIYDDSEFYHQLLRELIEHKSSIDENHADIASKYKELQKVRSKMKKKVDTRASKGRKIRYVVHNKLVNFMPLQDNSEWTDEARNELFSSLFGGANT